MCYRYAINLLQTFSIITDRSDSGCGSITPLRHSNDVSPPQSPQTTQRALVSYELDRSPSIDGVSDLPYADEDVFCIEGTVNPETSSCALCLNNSMISWSHTHDDCLDHGDSGNGGSNSTNPSTVVSMRGYESYV